jgi:hypothetical protein
MRSPQPAVNRRVRLRSVRVKRFVVMRQRRGRKTRDVMGSNRNAHLMDGWVGARSNAAVIGVAMVRVKVLFVLPGGRVGGLKEAVARFGRPVAASVIGLDMAPWGWTVKVKLAELPDGTVWVVVPVGVRVKSGLVVGPVPTVMI